jgi:hypothetical protein
LVEWIFAFETRRIVSRSKIDNVVDDIVKLLEYAKGFPQEHLMSAGQLSLNRHITHNPGIEPSLGGLSATLPLPDYGRVARQLTGIVNCLRPRFLAGW